LWEHHSLKIVVSRSNNPFAPAQAQSPVPPVPQNNNYPSFNLQGTYANGGAPNLAVSPPVSFIPDELYTLN
jgi:hypothetical protein